MSNQNNVEDEKALEGVEMLKKVLEDVEILKKAQEGADKAKEDTAIFRTKLSGVEKEIADIKVGTTRQAETLDELVKLSEPFQKLHDELALFNRARKQSVGQDEAFDKVLNLFQLSKKIVISVLTIFLTLLTFGLAAIGFQVYSIYEFQRDTRENFERTVAQAKAEALRDYRIFPYVARINGAVNKLKYGSRDDRTVAIWDDLLPILHQTKHRPDFFDIAIEFKNEVLPHLNLDATKENFLDSYRGELWICEFLLESEIDEVRVAVREKLPRIEKIKGIAVENKDKIKDWNDVEKSTQKLENILRGIK